jgi:hypothetical protein
MWRLSSWEPNLLRSGKFQSQCLSSLCNPLGIPNPVIGDVGDTPKVQILNFAFANCFAVHRGCRRYGDSAFPEIFCGPGYADTRDRRASVPIRDRNREMQFLVPWSNFTVPFSQISTERICK